MRCQRLTSVVGWSEGRGAYPGTKGLEVEPGCLENVAQRLLLLQSIDELSRPGALLGHAGRGGGGMSQRWDQRMLLWDLRVGPTPAWGRGVHLPSL